MHPVKHANIADLQHKFKGTSQEWEAILSHFLLHETNFVQNIRFVYTLQSDAIKLSFQQHIKGIKASSIFNYYTQVSCRIHEANFINR